ncbi:MAG: sigma factor-like helix-turn-helix DNA-binding protein [Phycisphaeraceae bacterium]
MALSSLRATRDDLDRRTAARFKPEQIVRLAQALPDEDRLLLERRYADGVSVAEIARRSRRSAPAVARRIERLTQRLASPEFRFTLTRQASLPKPMRRTATLLFIHGLSLRETARATGKTLHRVRCDRATLQTLARVDRLNHGETA